jgi:hypothetical protein
MDQPATCEYHASKVKYVALYSILFLQNAPLASQDTIFRNGNRLLNCISGAMARVKIVPNGNVHARLVGALSQMALTLIRIQSPYVATFVLV